MKQTIERIKINDPTHSPVTLFTIDYEIAAVHKRLTTDNPALAVAHIVEQSPPEDKILHMTIIKDTNQSLLLFDNTINK